MEFWSLILLIPFQQISLIRKRSDLYSAYIFLLSSSDISEDVPLALYSLAKLFVYKLFDDFLQEFLIDSELLVTTFLSHLEQLLECTVHLVVMGMLQRFDHCTLNDELSLSLNSLFIVIEGFNLFIKSFLELLR